MSLGIKASILIGGGILIVAGLVAVLFRPVISGLRKAAPETPAPTAAVKEAPPSVEPVPPATPRSATASETAAVSLRATALLFAERYGTYAARGNFENIIDLYPLMTDHMRASSDAFIAAARARQDREGVGLSGTTTRALALEVVTETALGATVTVTTQRTETALDGATSTYYQTVTLALIKAGDVWKVDSATWGAVR